MCHRTISEGFHAVNKAEGQGLVQQFRTWGSYGGVREPIAGSMRGVRTPLETLVSQQLIEIRAGKTRILHPENGYTYYFTLLLLTKLQY